MFTDGVDYFLAFACGVEGVFCACVFVVPIDFVSVVFSHGAILLFCTK